MTCLTRSNNWLGIFSVDVTEEEYQPIDYGSPHEICPNSFIRTPTYEILPVLSQNRVVGITYEEAYCVRVSHAYLYMKSAIELAHALIWNV
jgi:hypothetical protein